MARSTVICPHCKGKKSKNKCEVCLGKGLVTPCEWAIYKATLKLYLDKNSANG